MSPPANSVEGNIIVLVQWLKLAVESFGAGLVAVGVGVAIVQLIRTLAGKQPAEFTAIRLVLARDLALAPEFELGAGIPVTAISPYGIRSAHSARSR